MKLMFSNHAFKRMFDRNISPEDVRAVIERGEPIAEYPDDTPFPSRLLLCVVSGRALHVVLGHDRSTDTGYVITAYEPHTDLWDSEFKNRKMS